MPRLEEMGWSGYQMVDPGEQRAALPAFAGWPMGYRKGQQTMVTRQWSKTDRL